MLLFYNLVDKISEQVTSRWKNNEFKKNFIVIRNSTSYRKTKLKNTIYRRNKNDILSLVWK